MKQTNFQRMLACFLACILMLCVIPVSAAEQTEAGFRDVPSSAWFAESVGYCYENGLMVGVSESEFDPQGTVTREMVVSVLYRIAGRPAVQQNEPFSAFSDVAAGKWYTDAICWGEQNGIVYGISETFFGVGEAVTREQLVAFLYRYAQLDGCDMSCTVDLHTYADHDAIRAYAVEAMRWSVGAGIISGAPVEQTMRLYPRDDAKRSELSSTLMRYMKNVIGEIVGMVLYTNDVHTYLDQTLSYVTVNGMKNVISDMGIPTLLVDAGDHIQGTAYGSMDRGQSIVALMNAAGYDAATLGNHEFDYGMDRLLELIQSAEYTYLSTNFYHEQNGVRGENVLKPYCVFEMGEKKVALVGITTPESFTSSTPKYFQDESGAYIYGIAGGTDGTDLYQAVQGAVDAAAEEADYVIALGHLGVDPSSAPWRSKDVIQNTTGLDAFIDGHSHSTIEQQYVEDRQGQRVLLTQSGSYFDAIGTLAFHSNGRITASLCSAETMDAEAINGYHRAANPVVTELLAKWCAEVDEALGEEIGYAEITLDNYMDGKRLVRIGETNSGDFAADALYHFFDVRDYAVDVAVMNGGGVRNKALSGALSYRSMQEIHPFGNVACLQQVTGQQLLDALEWGARFAAQQESGGFLQVSGLRYSVNTQIPNTTQADEKGVWIGGPSGEYRVFDVQIKNRRTGIYEPLDLTKTYQLAGYNYTLRDMGDGFAMFQDAVNIVDYVAQDYMVLAEYVRTFPQDTQTGLPTITAENSPYESIFGNGRITVLP